MAVATSYESAEAGIGMLRQNSTDNLIAMDAFYGRNASGEMCLTAIVMASTSPSPSLFGASFTGPFILVMQLLDSTPPSSAFLSMLCDPGVSFATKAWELGGNKSFKTQLHKLCSDNGFVGMDEPAGRHLSLCSLTKVDLSQWTPNVYGPAWQPPEAFLDTDWTVSEAWL